MRTPRILLAAALIVLAACAHKANVTTSDDGKTTTVQTDQGSVTVGKAVDESKLGAPVYPGAESDTAATVSGTSDGTSGALAAFKTKDDFDKVYQFYKSKLPDGSEKMKMESGGTSMAMFDVKKSDNDETTVQITAKDGETQILITHKGA